MESFVILGALWEVFMTMKAGERLKIHRMDHRYRMQICGREDLCFDLVYTEDRVPLYQEIHCFFLLLISRIDAAYELVPLYWLQPGHFPRRVVPNTLPDAEVTGALYELRKNA